MPGVLLVTGASRGIGAETARLAAKRGYSVCVNYLKNSDAAGAVVSEITRSGGRSVAMQGDVALEADVVRLFEACDRELGLQCRAVLRRQAVGCVLVQVERALVLARRQCGIDRRAPEARARRLGIVAGARRRVGIER